uniref:D-glutamate cyclase-like C-terminal domain-containing protein n=1 Tax=Palpitomonas bilix TaxID=652834 RepID=A0A7S3LXL4_9EUKA|mmetsp:Transcript_8869/g.24075  ORF Transcript_8869/g.24075 Transcript_8869/m.24075 type:complete len:321 (+) Transcript_8869:236-1198(+)
MLRSALRTVEELLFSDPGGRGIAPLCVRGELEQTFSVLKGLRNAEEKEKTVCILSGFPVPPHFVVENDGPSGTAAIARAAAHLGCASYVVTDERCAAAFSAALVAGGAKDATVISLKEGRGREGEVDAELKRVFGGGACKAVFAIERVGCNADGRRLSMGGVDVTDVTTNVDAFFSKEVEGGRYKAGLDYQRVGIGDGGNELGMGKVRSEVEAHINRGKDIAAVEDCECLLTCGVSNWGGYAIEAMSLLIKHEGDGKAAMDVFLKDYVEREERVHAALVEEGCIDGIAKGPTKSVDGLPFDLHMQTIDKIAKAFEGLTNI